MLFEPPNLTNTGNINDEYFTAPMGKEQNRFMKDRRDIKIWYGRLEDAERYPDVPYRQAQTDEKKFEAAWQMVVEAYAIKGEDISESRLQRSVGGLRHIDEKKYQEEQ